MNDFEKHVYDLVIELKHLEPLVDLIQKHLIALWQSEEKETK
jgi:hypothetical protein